MIMIMLIKKKMIIMIKKIIIILMIIFIILKMIVVSRVVLGEMRCWRLQTPRKKREQRHITSKRNTENKRMAKPTTGKRDYKRTVEKKPNENPTETE